jgi:hypothetical protein
MNETLEQMKARIAYRVEHEAGFQPRSTWDLQISLDAISKDWWCFIHYVPSPYSHAVRRIARFTMRMVTSAGRDHTSSSKIFNATDGFSIQEMFDNRRN